MQLWTCASAVAQQKHVTTSADIIRMYTHAMRLNWQQAARPARTG